MAHWHVSRLIRELDKVDPNWRRLTQSDPYEAAEHYGIEVQHVTRDGYSELDFKEPDYGDLSDGFGDADRD